MITVIEKDGFVKCVRVEFTVIEWLVITRALKNFSEDKNNHAYDIRTAKKILDEKRNYEGG